jgi:hypothetical protein
MKKQKKLIKKQFLSNYFQKFPRQFTHLDKFIFRFRVFCRDKNAQNISSHFVRETSRTRVFFLPEVGLRKIHFKSKKF